jgi:hypothetical protein
MGTVEEIMDDIVTVVSQYCYRGIKVVLQWCSDGKMVLQWRYNGVTWRDGH